MFEHDVDRDVVVQPTENDYFDWNALRRGASGFLLHPTEGMMNAFDSMGGHKYVRPEFPRYAYNDVMQGPTSHMAFNYCQAGKFVPQYPIPTWDAQQTVTVGTLNIISDRIDHWNGYLADDVDFSTYGGYTIKLDVVEGSMSIPYTHSFASGRDHGIVVEAREDGGFRHRFVSHRVTTVYCQPITGIVRLVKNHLFVALLGTTHVMGNAWDLESGELIFSLRRAVW